MSFECFKELLTLNPGIRHVDLDNFGELFLNPDLLKIMEYAYSRNVMLSCPAGVNLNNVSMEVLEGLVKYRFHYLNISLDGATPDTYKIYRKGGDWNKVVENIKVINRFKKKYKSKYPKMQWQFIVFGHNEDEIETAKTMASDLGMSFYLKLNWNPEYSPIKNRNKVSAATGWTEFTREEYEQQNGVSYVRPTCYSLWTGPRYSWDLSVTGCCWNVWERFDESSISFSKEMLMGLRTSVKRNPCMGCEIYWELVKSERFLTRFEILKYIIRSRARTSAAYLLWRLGL